VCALIDCTFVKDFAVSDRAVSVVLEELRECRPELACRLSEVRPDGPHSRRVWPTSREQNSARWSAPVEGSRVE
jgi:hypothetical protein